MKNLYFVLLDGTNGKRTLTDRCVFFVSLDRAIAFADKKERDGYDVTVEIEVPYGEIDK